MVAIRSLALGKSWWTGQNLGGSIAVCIIVSRGKVWTVRVILLKLASKGRRTRQEVGAPFWFELF
jgi:hypothetical protein